MARRSDLLKTFNKLLSNRFVLYFITIVALVHVIGYLAMSNYNALLFFVVASLLTAKFTKNLSIVFLSGILLTNIIYFSKFMGRNMMEGFEGKKKDKKDKKEKMKNNTKKSTPKDDDDEDDDDAEDLTERLDTQEQLSNSYKRLEKIMNPDQMKAMTKESMNLMNDQKNLMKQMETMTPMINQVTKMVDGMGGLDKIAGMADKLGGGLNFSKFNKKN